ncbi:hypothetical protein Alg130_08842 [Pyrenophora tritici-repentis]|nr:hypothetical protein A1F99_129230 [Pyrenophora tritici-repentis]KAI0576342.1 hypothetical protein Alg130_08842 [Pyrenophora tritici-repentis]KAI1528300.1 hypothetical protein PtrSN001A_009026 [Pyrenophora tritici-repentis]KAI1563698.1 hypothetical protein PtrEW4_009259 [Pyrenophora tritici-repentis]KAI1584729.1 hypothetical protein PtrEW13061_008307 [Pyrenophora tritici-repentis]
MRQRRSSKTMQQPHTPEMQTARADTSSLTTLPSSPPTGNSGRPYATPHSAAQDKAMNDLDPDSDSDDPKSSKEQTCPGCDNTYLNAAALNGHLADRRSLCGRNLHEASIFKKVWCCPRCGVQMGKKYSTERHIKDSCWKVCNECCESGKATCDAIHSNKPCTHCTDEGKPCTKRTGLLENCEPEMNMIPIEHALHIAPKSTKNGAIPGGRRLHGKRKAVTSPEPTSDVTHETKRPAVLKKKGNTTPSRSPLPSTPKLSPDIAGATQEQARLWRDDQGSLPKDDQGALPKHDQGALPKHDQEPQPDRVGLPGPRSTFTPTLIQELEAQRLQLQQAQRFPTGKNGAQQLNSNYPHMQLIQQSQGSAVPSGYQYQTQPWSYQPGGGVPSNDLPMRNLAANMPLDDDTAHKQLSATVHKLQHEMQRLKGFEGHIPAAMRAKPPVPNNIQPSMSNLNTFDPEFNYAPGTMSGVERFRRAQNQDIDGFPAAVNSAPGSHMPSRQSSPFPLHHRRRLSTHRMSSLQQQELGALSNIVAKESIVRNSTKPIAMQRSTTPTPDKKAPYMRLKIHSNTYDINGNPIFSILTMRASQKFGPRLDAYCQHRKKQYGVDWDFFYQYWRHDQGIRFIKIEYDMAPVDVYDKEFPLLRLQDMGTIMVARAKPRVLTGVQNDGTNMFSPMDSQVSEEIVDITDGETQIYQDAGTITQWHRDVESKMTELSMQVNNLNAELATQKRATEQQTCIAKQLELENRDLTRNNHMLNGLLGAGGRPPMPKVANQQPVPTQRYHTRRPSISAPPYQTSFASHQINPHMMHNLPSQPSQPHSAGPTEPFPDYDESKVTDDALRLLIGRTPGPELDNLNMKQILEQHGVGPLS